MVWRALSFGILLGILLACFHISIFSILFWIICIGGNCLFNILNRHIEYEISYYKFCKSKRNL